MKNHLVIHWIVGLLVIVAGIGYWYVSKQIPAPASKDNLIIVSTPLSNAIVESPLVISGKARGYWYFEASFPAKLYDDNGNLLGVMPVQAQGEWMTQEYVPFSATLIFTPPTTLTGTLVLEKDNPSGLPENANELRIPVRFQTTATTSIPERPKANRAVQLYFYNSVLDSGEGGASCSRNGLVSVKRTIPSTSTPLKDVITLLLQGNPTEVERAQGITTEFPQLGVGLLSASIKDGVATLTFNDPQNRTIGGSCRAMVLWLQIEATAKQFPSVTSVRFMPEYLFQP